jgi:hypothetical protein
MKSLLITLAKRNNHLAAVAELFDKRLRYALRGAGHDDLVKRRVFRPALVTVADLDLHVRVTQLLETLDRLFTQSIDDFNRVNLLHDQRQHGCLVAAPRADFQHAVTGLGIEQCRHVGDQVRRRNGLFMTDGQSLIVVGLGAQFRAYE